MTYREKIEAITQTAEKLGTVKEDGSIIFATELPASALPGLDPAALEKDRCRFFVCFHYDCCIAGPYKSNADECQRAES